MTAICAAVRTRMPGGVGGAVPRGTPLSRSCGSIELGLGGHIDSGKTERVEIAVAQRLLDRWVP